LTPSPWAASVVSAGFAVVVARRAVRSEAVSTVVTTSAAAAGSTPTPSTDGSSFGALLSMTNRASCARGSTPPNASATSAPSLALSTTGLRPPSAAGAIDKAAP
jgi:hypothetical protein